MLDCAWSPTHPALFAAVDGSGRLDLWNLNQDTEVPAATVQVEGSPALNRVSWTPSGLHVTVGDDTGKIWVYDVAEVRIHRQTLTHHYIYEYVNYTHRGSLIHGTMNGTSSCTQYKSYGTTRLTRN